MRRRRTSALLAGTGAVLGGLLVLGLGNVNGSELPESPGPAPPAALAKIAAQNERASRLAAARVHANVQENLQIADAEFARSQQPD